MTPSKPLGFQTRRPVALGAARSQSQPVKVLALAAATMLAGGMSLHAAIYNWVPTLDGTFNWDNSGGQNNWSIPSAFPNAVSDVANITSNITGLESIDLNIPITIGALTIGDPDGSAGFNITPGIGGSLNFNNGAVAATIAQTATSLGDSIFAPVTTVGNLNISNASANSLILNGPISSSAANGTQTITNTGGLVRLSGPISDGISGGKIALVMNGTGTMSLVGDNTFTGGVTLTNGTLNIGYFTALGATSSTFTIAGGKLDNNTGGIIFLVNNNAQIWAGDFSFGSASGSSDLDLGTGAVGMTGNRTITVNSNNLTIGGVISDASSGFSLTKAGAGTLTLTGENTYGGVTTVSQGILNIQNSSALGTNASAVVSAGATLQLQGGIEIIGKTLTLNGEGIGNAGTLRNISGDNVWTGPINPNTAASIVRIGSDSGSITLNGDIVTSGTNQFVFQGNGDGIVNGVISGTAPLTRSTTGTGIWTLNAANTYTGNTTVSNGAFRLGNANAMQSTTLADNAANGLYFKEGIGTFNLGNLAGSSVGSFALTDDAFAPVILQVGATNTSTTSANSISGSGSLVKVGTGTLTLSGTNSFSGGITASNGTLVLSGNNSISGNISINGGALTASDASLTGASVSKTTNTPLGTTTITLTSNTFNVRANGQGDASTQVISLGNNDVTVTGAATISTDRASTTGGTAKIIKLGNLTLGTSALTVTGANGFGVQFGTATLTDNVTINPTTGFAVLGDVVQSGGVRSLTKTGTGRLVIIGSTSYSGGTTVTDGTLQIGNGGYTGTISGNIATSGGTILFNRADNTTYSGQISGTGGLTKMGDGTLTLNNSNSFSGTVGVTGGTLLLDYATTPSILSGTNALTLGAGTLYVKGAATGTTAQSFGGLTTLLTMTGKIVLDPNGGAGTTLTIGDTWTFGGSNGLHIDLSRGGTVVSNPKTSNGVIVGETATVARVTTTGTDGKTYFATVSGGNVVPQTTLSPLAANTVNGNGNFQISGNLVTTGPVQVGTLRIDTSTAAGSLDIAGGSLTFDRTAFLMDGSNDFEIKRSSGTGTIANTVIHQYGTGTLIYSAPIAAGGGFTKNGPGLLVGNMTSGGPGSVTITDGVYRVATAAALPTGNTNLAGGVLELASGDLTLGLGTGTPQVRLTADAGFSAFGADHFVNLGGTGGTVAWDNSTFLPNNSTFLLSSTKSNAMIDFQNPIALGGFTRTVRVENGSAAVDAQLSGALNGTMGFVKTGPGTLRLTAANPFSGTTSIRNGALILNGTVAGPVEVRAGTLKGNGDGALTGVISGSLTVGDGLGTADAILSPGETVGTLTALGALSLVSDAQFRFELDSSLGLADRMAANGISIASGVTFQSFDLAISSTALALGTSFIVLDNTSFDPIAGFFSNLTNGSLLTIGANTFQANYGGGTGNDLALVVVLPEPSSAFMMLAGSMLLGMRRRRKA